MEDIYILEEYDYDYGWQVFGIVTNRDIADRWESLGAQFPSTRRITEPRDLTEVLRESYE